MPGVVLEIKVTKGQKVKKEDLLVIIEAMKMENEVFAKNSGTVTEIYAAKGRQVNTGDPLILIV
jgi:biotin carboxyl carrier protein